MSNQKLPPGWDNTPIREGIDHYDSQDDDERAAEIAAAWEAEGMTLMVGSDGTGPGDPRSPRP